MTQQLILNIFLGKHDSLKPAAEFFPAEDGNTFIIGKYRQEEDKTKKGFFLIDDNEPTETFERMRAIFGNRTLEDLKANEMRYIARRQLEVTLKGSGTGAYFDVKNLSDQNPVKLGDGSLAPGQMRRLPAGSILHVQLNNNSKFIDLYLKAEFAHDGQPEPNIPKKSSKSLDSTDLDESDHNFIPHEDNWTLARLEELAKHILNVRALRGAYYTHLLATPGWLGTWGSILAKAPLVYLVEGLNWRAFRDQTSQNAALPAYIAVYFSCTTVSGNNDTDFARHFYSDLCTRTIDAIKAQITEKRGGKDIRKTDIVRRELEDRRAGAVKNEQAEFRRALETVENEIESCFVLSSTEADFVLALGKLFSVCASVRMQPIFVFDEADHLFDNLQSATFKALEQLIVTFQPRPFFVLGSNRLPVHNDGLASFMRHFALPDFLGQLTDDPSMILLCNALNLEGRLFSSSDTVFKDMRNYLLQYTNLHPVLVQACLPIVYNQDLEDMVEDWEWGKLAETDEILGQNGVMDMLWTNLARDEQEALLAIMNGNGVEPQTGYRLQRKGILFAPTDPNDADPLPQLWYEFLQKKN